MTTALVLEAIAFIQGVKGMRIAQGLYQGSAPPYGHALRDAGFDVVVLCASEFQPPVSKFPGVEVLRCRLDDVVMNDDIWKAAVLCAQEVARFVRAGKTVLVTCAFGWNRSGLVNAMILHELEGISGKEAVRRIRKLQPGSLDNESFTMALEAILAA